MHLQRFHNWYRPYRGGCHPEPIRGHPERSEGSAFSRAQGKLREGSAVLVGGKKADSTARQKPSALRMTLSAGEWQSTVIVKTV